MTSLIRRHRDFRLLWVGETSSRLGTSVTTVVLPLVAVSTLHASTFNVSLLTAAAWLPWLLIGLVAGSWVDRLRRRPLMIWCDVISAVFFASVPVAVVMGHLTDAQLLVVALGAGCASVMFTTAYGVYIIDLMSDKADRAIANSALQGSASAAQIGGPGLGGLLAQALGAATALLADSLSFLISAACLVAIRAPEPPLSTKPREQSLRSQVAEGVRYLRHDPLLRPLVLFGGTANLALIGYQAILIVFLVRDVGLKAGTIGLLLGLISCGGLIGAIVANPIARRLGTGRALLLTKVGACPFALLIPLTASGPRLALLVIGGLGVGIGIVAGNVISTGFTQAYVPTTLYARMSATTNVFNCGTMPIGAVLGGTLGATLGLQTALWITTALLPASALILVASPLRRLRWLPVRLTESAGSAEPGGATDPGEAGTSGAGEQSDRPAEQLGAGGTGHLGHNRTRIAGEVGPDSECKDVESDLFGRVN
jgi:MFS family permease